MQVPITKFRQELFRLADQAMEGVKVEFVYKGVVFHVVPEQTRASKLDRLVSQPTVVDGFDLDQASRELTSGMEAAWLKDWSEI